jgi:hypothetical protein
MLLVVAVASAAPGVPPVPCAGEVLSGFDPTAARGAFAAARTADDLTAALRGVGLGPSGPGGPSGPVVLDVFRAALYGPRKEDLVVQPRGGGVLTGASLHPLGGGRWCALPLPFLPGPAEYRGGDWTFAFVALTDPVRQSVRVDHDVATPYTDGEHIGLWEIRDGRWVELYAVTTENASVNLALIGPNTWTSVNVEIVGDTFPRRLSVTETTSAWVSNVAVDTPHGRVVIPVEGSGETDRATGWCLVGQRYAPCPAGGGP